jgi:pseudouridine synthase
MKSESTLSDGLVRLEKYIANQGLASRREVKQLILDGNVLVNGVVMTETGLGIDPSTDHVEVHQDRSQKQTVVLYKPRGIETSKTDTSNQDIHDVYPELSHLAPIGRLDKESEGLILLSNDGLVARVITSDQSDVEKEYLVTVREMVTDEAVRIMSAGILLDEKMTLPAVVEKLDDHTFSIILREGRKHQIRRMADACRLTIENLKRIRVGNVTLETLKEGEYKTVSFE